MSMISVWRTDRQMVFQLYIVNGRKLKWVQTLANLLHLKNTLDEINFGKFTTATHWQIWIYIILLLVLNKVFLAEETSKFMVILHCLLLPKFPYMYGLLSWVTTKWTFLVVYAWCYLYNRVHMLVPFNAKILLPIVVMSLEDSRRLLSIQW